MDRRDDAVPLRREVEIGVVLGRFEDMREDADDLLDFGDEVLVSIPYGMFMICHKPRDLASPEPLGSGFFAR
jgi:hypothetical protein